MTPHQRWIDSIHARGVAQRRDDLAVAERPVGAAHPRSGAAHDDPDDDHPERGEHGRQGDLLEAREWAGHDRLDRTKGGGRTRPCDKAGHCTFDASAVPSADAPRHRLASPNATDAPARGRARRRRGLLLDGIADPGPDGGRSGTDRRRDSRRPSAVSSAAPATTEPNASATTATSAAIAQAAPTSQPARRAALRMRPRSHRGSGRSAGPRRSIPILVSAQSIVGPNRFLWAIASTSNEPIAAPDTPSRVRFYALERDPETPYATARGNVRRHRDGPRPVPHVGGLRLRRPVGCRGRGGAAGRPGRDPAARVHRQSRWDDPEHRRASPALGQPDGGGRPGGARCRPTRAVCTRVRAHGRRGGLVG